MTDAQPSPQPRRVGKFQKFLFISAIPTIFLSVALAVRLVWEQTSLTFQQGPQMIGFSLAHGYYGALLLAPFVLILWLLAAIPTILTLLVRHRFLSRWFLSSVAASIIVFGILILPSVFWQWLFIGTFAKSPHASDLMTYAAAEGDLHTVSRYLSHGVPLESKDYQGSTAVFNAAAAGNLKIVELLASKRANLNVINSYGDSPLEAATANHKDDVAAFLRAHGAIQIKGTPEQRDAANEAIVQMDIDRMAKQMDKH